MRAKDETTNSAHRWYLNWILQEGQLTKENGGNKMYKSMESHIQVGPGTS